MTNDLNFPYTLMQSIILKKYYYNSISSIFLLLLLDLSLRSFLREDPLLNDQIICDIENYIGKEVGAFDVYPKFGESHEVEGHAEVGHGKGREKVLHIVAQCLMLLVEFIHL